MSIYLQSTNWLVADWVMRKLKMDIASLNLANRYSGIYSDLVISEKHYTFLLDYSNFSKEKTVNLSILVQEIISGYKEGILRFNGQTDAFDSYKEKLLELQIIVDNQLNNFHEDA
jgi:hypothetical protein